MSRLPAAKQKFVTSWGEMGSCWGINKTMAQIHALLIASEKPLSTDEVMKELQISRGNANMNLRELINWGLIRRTSVPGDRKEYFFSETDVWKMFCTIARERKKREIEPVIRSLEECMEMVKEDKSGKDFRNKLDELLGFVKMADTVLGKIAASDKDRIISYLMKAIR
jgi:DNA-binding transcriptional regulator GbsR (MarR family)